jgi:hypothetical protein
VLGLAEEVGGHERRVGGGVGQDQDLGRPGEQIDTHPAEQLSLRLGDVGVAGADDHVDALQLVQPERKRGQSLDAAEADDLVGPRGGDRVQRGRVDAAALARRGRGHDPPYAGHLRHDHGHEGRREHRVAAPRHVGADGFDRHVPVPEPHATQRLHVEIRERRELALGEVAHARLREGDVPLELLRQRGGGGLDLLGADQERVWRPVVEPAREVADGLLAAPLDVGQHALDRALDLLVRGGRRRGGALQVVGHRQAARTRSSGASSTCSSKPSSRDSPAAAPTTAAPISL